MNVERRLFVCAIAFCLALASAFAYGPLLKDYGIELNAEMRTVFGALGVISIIVMVWGVLSIFVYNLYSKLPPTSVDILVSRGFTLRDAKALSQRASLSFIRDICDRNESGNYSLVWHHDSRSDLMKDSLWHIGSVIRVRRMMFKRKTRTDDILDTARLILLGFSEDDMRGAPHEKLLELHERDDIPVEHARSFYDNGIHPDLRQDIFGSAPTPIVVP